MTAKKATEKADAPEEVTYSRLMSWLTCPQKEFYQYRAGGFGIQTVESHIPFIEGAFGHYALEHWYKPTKDNQPRMQRKHLLNRIEKVLDPLREAGLSPEDDDKIRIRLAAIMGACLGYTHKYASDHEKFKVLYIEEPFEFECAGVVIRGKIDLILEEKKTGRVFFMEHKFVGDVSPDTYVVLPMDLQGLLYSRGFEEIVGELPDYRVWNYITKTRLRRKKQKGGGRETMDSFEARVTQQYLNEADKKFFRPPPLRIYKTTLLGVEDQLKRHLDAMLNGTATMNFGSCRGMYGKACPFAPACIELLQNKAEGWNAPACKGLYRKKESLHPELEGD